MRHNESDNDDDELVSEVAVDAQLRSSLDAESVSSYAENGPLSPTTAPSVSQNESKRPISWSELPRKDQLFIITMARMSEPLVQTSLQVRLTPNLGGFTTFKAVWPNQAHEFYIP